MDFIVLPFLKSPYSVGEFQVPVLSFVAVALAIASVGVLVVRARKFRDNILGGEISFGKAMLYCVQTFFLWL